MAERNTCGNCAQMSHAIYIHIFTSTSIIELYSFAFTSIYGFAWRQTFADAVDVEGDGLRGFVPLTCDDVTWDTVCV